KRVMFDDQVVRGGLHYVVGSKAKVIVVSLRRRVDPPALVTAERALLVVVGDDVLAKLGANRLEPVPKMPDDREIPKDGMPALHEIVGDPCDKADDDGDPQHGVRCLARS